MAKRGQNKTATPSSITPPKLPPEAAISTAHAVTRQLVGDTVFVSAHAHKRSFPGSVDPEARARNLEVMRQHAIKPGEVRNPFGPGKRRPYQAAALALADMPMDQVAITAQDTVATALYKCMALRGSLGDVSAVKELADRAEGPSRQAGDDSDQPQVNVFVSTVINGLLGALPTEEEQQ